MEEKEIAKAESILNKKKIYIIVLILVSITIVFSIIYANNTSTNDFYDTEKWWAQTQREEAHELVEEKKEKYDEALERWGSLGLSSTIEKYEKEYEEAINEAIDAEERYQETFKYVYKETNIFLTIACCTGTIAVSIIVFSWYAMKMRIVVTNKRVYGKAAFGKRVDLPIDSISVVGTSFLNGIDIGTSSGRIAFRLMKNNQEIHSEISKLLNDRQNQKQEQLNSNNSSNISTTEELKRYKDLLDSGVITQEEFEAKKKQLLNLN